MNPQNVRNETNAFGSDREEYGAREAHLFATYFTNIYYMKTNGDRALERFVRLLPKFNIGKWMVRNEMINAVLQCFPSMPNWQKSHNISVLAARNRYKIVLGSMSDEYITEETVYRAVRFRKPDSLDPVQLCSMYECLPLEYPYECLKMMRPIMRLHLKYDDSRDIGCIDFELYMETAPSYIVDLLTTCLKNFGDMFKFRGGSPSEHYNWLEFEKKFPRSLIPQSELITFGQDYLMHNQHDGLLCLSPDTLNMLRFGRFVCSLVLDRFQYMDTKHIPIGRVVSDLAVVQSLGNLLYNGEGKSVTVSECSWPV